VSRRDKKPIARLWSELQSALDHNLVDQARSTLRSIIQQASLDKDRNRARKLLACLLETNDKNEAKRQYEALVAAGGADEGFARLVLASAQEATSTPDAIQAYWKIVELRPDSPSAIQALLELCRLHSLQGDSDTASMVEKRLAETLERDRNREGSLHVVVELQAIRNLQTAGDFTSAIARLTELITHEKQKKSSANPSLVSFLERKLQNLRAAEKIRDNKE
jgi:hypothetical protein